MCMCACAYVHLCVCVYMYVCVCVLTMFGAHFVTTLSDSVRNGCGLNLLPF